MAEEGGGGKSMEIHLDAQSDAHLLVLVLQQRPFILKFLSFFLLAHCVRSFLCLCFVC